MKQLFMNCFFLVLQFVVISNGFAGGIKTPAPQNTIKFTENKNQWDKKVLYRAQLDGGVLFLEKNAFTYNFYDKETLRKNHVVNTKSKSPLIGKPIRSHAFRMTFLGAEKTVEAFSKQITHDYCNYFIGNDKSKWVGNAKNYKEVNYKNLYTGIDLQILGYQNSIKTNFIVAPQGNTADINLFYEGLDHISIQKGALVLKTSVNEMVEEKPYAFQLIDGKKIEVPCKFVLENNTVSFNFPKGYNKDYELIIDPVLVFACSSGSTADNFGMTATYDAQGNLYSGGTCFDIGFPTTLGAYDTSFNGLPAYGITDVVITKYDSSGSFLQYSTYLGGSNSTEIVTSLVVDAQNNLFAYGATGSNDFPVTSNAYDQTFNGGILLYFQRNGSYFDYGTDIYVAKLNPTGTSLLASTYIGGSLNDGVNVNNDSTLLWGTTYEFPADSLQYNYGDQYRGEINVDQYGNAYIASSTRSSNFPIANGFDNTLGGEQDAVAFKFNSDLSQLIWSTYLGGSDNDAGYALAMDDSSNVFITGGTRSTNFPTTTGVLKPAYNGGKADGYITKIKSDGTSILNSTFWGTNAYDQTYFVQLDKNNNVYVVGQTQGAMPTTAGVYKNPNSGQFISKMNESLNTLMFSTVFGNGNGQPNISPSAFLVDYCENIYVSGWGGNIITGPGTFNMPLTANAIQSSNPDGYNFYLFVLSTNADSLLYATYFGGNQSQEHVDGGTSRFDKKGIIYQSVCAGCGGYDDFPVTPGSWPNTGANVNHAGNCNNGTFKFDFQVAIADANFTVNYYDGCAPLTVHFDNQSTQGGTYLWNFGNGDTTSTTFDPTRTFPTPGTYLIQLFVNNPASCNTWDTAFQYVTVYPDITADFNVVTTPCISQAAFYDSSATAPISWLWDFGDGDSSSFQNPTHVYAADGTYTVQLISSTMNGCKDTAVVPVTFLSPVPVSIISDTTICKGNSVQLTASGGVLYNWSPALHLTDTTIANPVASPDTTTTYTALITTVNTSGDSCIQTLSTTVIVIRDEAIFSVDNLTGCPVLNVQFYNQSSSGTNYLWDFGNNDTTSVILNPLRVFPLPGTYLVQLFTNNPARCNSWDTASQYVTVYPAITADFNVSTTPCTTQAAFIDSSFVAPVSWQWNFGDGASDSIQNPTHIYNALGTYSVQLISINANGCNDTTVIPVSFIPPVPVSIIPDTTLCKGNNIQLFASGGVLYNWSPASHLTDATIPNPVANPDTTTTYTVTITTVNSLGDTCIQTLSTIVVVTQDQASFTVDNQIGCPTLTVQFNNQSTPGGVYLWDFGNNDTTSTVFNPIRNFPTPGTYLIQLFVNNPARCNIWDTAFQSITVYPDMTADFDFSTIPCTTQAEFFDSSAVAPFSWSWHFDDGDSSAIQNPIHVYDTSGTYNVELISANVQGCKDTVVVQVDFVGVNPVLISPNATICKGNNTQLTANGGFNYSWSPAAGLNNPAISNPVANPVNTTTYTVVISTVNSMGDTCLKTLSTTIAVSDPSTFPLEATVDKDTIAEGQSTIIHAITDTAFSVQWSPVSGLSNPNSANSAASPEATTTYAVTITDSAGCTKTADVTIYIVSMKCTASEVFVPNTFTPNEDGKNDILFVRTNEFTDVYFAVYNRWGELVFETTDIKKGWDGMYKGMKSDPAVFAWYLRATCYNGNELKKKGNVTLIR